MSDAVLKQQIEYYRARAGEYDEWFYRVNRYDQGEALNRQWFAEAEQVAQALNGLGTFDRALELAAGTGIWTEKLAGMAKHVTAIDASEEVLRINREKLHASADAERVSYQQMDVFAWEPAEQYDLVFFGFWLSHVPQARVTEFLAKAARATRPGGHLFIVDSRAASTSTARNQSLETDENALQTRRLNDGSEYQIYKIYYQPETLQPLLANAGFEATVQVTEHYFVYAHGVKR